MRKNIILAVLMAVAFHFNVWAAIDPDKHWNCDPSLYPNNMTVVGMVKIDGVEQSSNALEVGAFCGTQCRGSEKLQYFSQVDRYLVFLTVYGADNDAIAFKLYDHGTGEELDAYVDGLTFVTNDMHGTPIAPYAFDFIPYYTVTAAVNPTGTASVSGTGHFLAHTNVSLTATPHTGYRFVNWTENGVEVGTASTLQFELLENRSLVANFEMIMHHVNVSVNDVNKGTATGSGDFQEGTSVTVSATPNTGFQFDNWTVNGEVVSTNANYTFSIWDDRNLVANFSILQVHINASNSPSDGGSVSGVGTYDYETTVTLTAHPAFQYVFDNWMENGNVFSTEPSISFTAYNDRSFVANYHIELPELHITSISHSDFIAGQPATVTWTVRNDGIAPTPDGAIWYDRVWLSVETRVAADDNNPRKIGEFVNLSALAPGEYYTQTQTFNIPLNMSGPYYLFVITDAYDCHTIFWENNEVPMPYNPPPYLGALTAHGPGSRVLEQSEYDNLQYHDGWHDNFFYDYLTIEVPPLADLQVTSIIAPENIYSGTTATVVATITNMGDAHTNVSHWTDALYVSQSDVFDENAIRLGTIQHNGILAPNESYDVTLSGGIPLTWYGTVYFYVATDIYGQVYEHVANDNNMSRSQAVNVILTPPADLVPTSITIPSSVSTGQQLSVSFTIYNQGAGNPNVNSWCDKIYLSANPNALENAIELKTVNHYNGLASNATYTITESLWLPSTISAGNYYVYVMTDANDQVFEYTFEDNNVLRSPSAVNVTQPDLIVRQITAASTMTVGYPASIRYILKNNGTLIDNISVTDHIFMSPNADMSNAILISTETHTLNMPRQRSSTFNCSVPLPNMEEGTYYLFVKTDVTNAVNESDEENNSLSKYPVTVLHQPLPDLIPTAFVLPTEIQAGSVVAVEFDVSNSGDLDLINSNCAMEVYAEQNGQQILCPMQTQTTPQQGNISIPANGSLHFSQTILIPANVNSACNTFVLKVDAQEAVAELNETNNTMLANAVVTDCPLPDLTVSNIVLPDAVQAGGYVSIAFDIENNGDAVLETTDLPVAVYAIVNGQEVLCPLQSQIEPTQGEAIQVAVGESIHFVQNVLVPPTIEPTCTQMRVTVDPNNTLFETNEDNNSTTVSATLLDYPFDLTVQSIDFPSEVTAGQTYSVSWTVKNIGTCPTESVPMFVPRNNTYYQVMNGTLPAPWVDKIYFSSDESISSDDVCVITRNWSTVLNPDDTYTMTVSIEVPYTVLGNPYLIAATDCTTMTYDMNRNNNTASQQLTVLLGELPDLRITAIDVDPILTADLSYTITYIVINEGECATAQSMWKDVFYLSATEGNTSGAYRLGECTHNGVLAVGESYEATINVTIPSSISGDYFYIGFTDATSLVYEHDNEDDNMTSIPVSVVLPLPCDLIAVAPSYPSTAVSGNDITVSWTLFNTGDNPATGRIRDAVYLSTDDEWGSDDIMLGYVENNINLEPNGQQDFEMTTTIQGVPHGSYYLIIKTNILHALNEASYDNNTCVGDIPMDVDYPVLAIGSSVDRTMGSDQYIYYKIEVGPEYEHQTLSCQLTTTSSYPGNGLYMAYESAPSMSQFDFSVNTPYEQNLEILIPSLEQGEYYLLARGSAEGGQPQNVTISAEIIDFEILHINADHGSNTGSLTTQVLGAKFDSIMDFRLVQGEEYMPAEKVFFSNSTESFVTFNLTDLQAGLYDVEAELPGGVITIKDGAFTVEEGLPAELSVNIIAPSSVRSGNIFTVTIEYGNIGTTDLNVSGLVIVSQNGHYISFDTEGLANRDTQLYLETAEPNGNPDVLRPGTRATRPIFVKASNTGTVRLGVYAVRNIY